MNEDHIKTVVIDPPLEKLARDETLDEPRQDRHENYDNENGQTELPRSWLS